MGKKILVVEDDGRTRDLVRSALEEKGYLVVEADGAKVGLHLFGAQKPDLVILDIHLPDGSGLDVCRKIRERKDLSTTPVIMLTGRSGLEDKESGFTAGADQYLVKPVAPRELVLWVEALLRRLAYDCSEGDELRVGDLAIDVKAHLVRYGDETVSRLTVKEFELLYFLVGKRPQVLSRKYILSHLWHTIAVDRVVDTHIHNLRKKLPAALAAKLQSVPGKGFRFFA